MADCGTWVRINDVPYRRTMGASESFTHADAPPPGASYEYHIMIVRDDRTQAPYPENGSWMGSSPYTYAGCPESSVPVTHGTIVDWGYTLALQACPGSCFASGFFEGYDVVENLRSHIGAEVRIFGHIGGGSIEGNYIYNVDHFELAPCTTVIPARPTTWGRLKAIYR